MKPKTQIPVRVRFIQFAVACHYDLKFEDMWKRGRAAKVAWPRQVAMVLAYKKCSVSQTVIGRAFNRHGDTVQWARKAVADVCSVTPALAAQVKELEARL